MNIAHLLPYSAKFPLIKHNGRYEWVLRLANLQSAHGHTVSIYSAPGSGQGIPEIQFRSIPYDFQDKTQNNLALIKTALQQPSHDIYHSHFDYLHYFVADGTTKPFISTQHWFPEQKFAEAARYNYTRNLLAVPVTDLMSDQDKKLDLPHTNRIYHGIDLAQFPANTGQRTDRLVYVGRISPRKGVHIAVQAALAAGAKLDIIGKVEPKDEKYWQEILPHIDGDKIRYLGPKPHHEIPQIFAQAKAFIFPSQAEEAFGMVTIEAQASGTPVIISDVGASRELVQHGKTGFICTTEQDYVHAIQQIPTIDAAICRANAERFSLESMANSYESLYQRLATAS